MIMPAEARIIQPLFTNGCRNFHMLKKVLNSKGYSTAVGDEGGFAPNLKSNEEALEVMEAIEKAGYIPKDEVLIALDPAASEFYNTDTGLYEFKWSDESKERYRYNG